jgi:hypothetical protein
MTSKEKEQIAGEIENEGFEYWLINYAGKSLVENNAPQHVIDIAKKAADVLEEAETIFEAEGLFLD